MNKIVLFGNPNSGKTTLFNGLTGKRERVGNWHGVTVEGVGGRLKGSDIEVFDLPGCYSLTAYSEEEKASVSALREVTSLAVNVIEARSVERSLKLTEQVLALGRRVLVVVNMYEELEGSGGWLDAEKLSEAIGCTCIIADLSSAKGIALVKEGILRCLNAGALPSKRVNKSLLKGSFYVPEYALSKWDRLLLKPWFALPVFAAVLFAVFYMTFGKYGISCVLSHFLTELTDRLGLFVRSKMCEAGLEPFAVGLVCDGVIAGLGGVVGFIPQLGSLQLSMIFLEESGYLPRAAFILDGALKKVGLSGRAVLPMLVGFGCTATAVTATRGMENKGVQARTVLAVQFISCSARTPVFMAIVSAFFEESGFLAVIGIYLLSVALAITASAAAFGLKRGEEEPFVTELPPMRMPKLKTAVKQLNYYLKSFIIKMATVLFAVSVFVWLLRSFSPSFEFLGEEQIADSILAKIGGSLSFLFHPMGITGWQVPVAALCGLVAKEGMVTALTLCYPLGMAGEISAQSAVALLLFSAYYTPCVMAISASVGEVGGRYSAFYAVFTFTVALFVGYFAYLLCLMYLRLGAAVMLSAIVAVIVIACAVSVIIKRIINKKVFCDKNCSFCKRKTCKDN